MTPMIDCVFLLIVFFVCIDFKVLEAKLPAWLPRDVGSNGGRKVEPNEYLAVEVREVAIGTRVFADGTAADVVPVEPATGRPRRFTVRGHAVDWTISSIRVAEERDLVAQLRRIHDDRSTWQDDREHPGQRTPMAVVVEAFPGVYCDDVARTADLVRAAGFREVSFGGGLGPRRPR